MRVVVEVAYKNRSLILCRCHSTDEPPTNDPRGSLVLGQVNLPSDR